VTGNQDFSPYRSLILLERSEASITISNGSIHGPGQNRRICVGEKKKLNIGLDFTFQTKDNGSLEYYIRKVKGLLWEFRYLPTYLILSFTNVGTISNRGVELVKLATHEA
jgi:hypothetical protein